MIKLEKYSKQSEGKMKSLIIDFWQTHNATSTEEDALKDIRNWTSKGHLLFKIIFEDLFIGFLHLGSRGASIDWIEDIFVETKYQNKGIGSAAIIEVDKYIHEQGLATTYIEVVPSNIKAMKLYHKLGFINLNTITLCKSTKVKTILNEETINGLNFKVSKPNI